MTSQNILLILISHNIFQSGTSSKIKHADIALDDTQYT